MATSTSVSPPSWSKALARAHPLNLKRAGRTTPPVYSRDFAYAHARSVLLVHRPMRVERDNVGSTSARSFAQLLSGPTVDIYVGKEGKCWTLHRNLLCHHSSYFESEFEGHEVPRNRDRRSLELPDDDPRGFELLVKWLYQGRLEEVCDFADDEGKYDYATACHKLYVLCDKFDMIQLKNLAMDQYRRGLHQAQLVPDAEEMDEIYRSSPHHSPFRKLMTKIAARQIMDPEVENHAESYRKCFEDNPDFAVEMITNIRTMSGGILFDDPTKPDDDCLYHDHAGGSGSHAKEKSNGKAKPFTNGADLPKSPVLQKRQIPSATPSPTLSKQAPVELSAERRTPRKLNVSGQHQAPARKTSALRSQRPQPVPEIQTDGNRTATDPKFTTAGPGKSRTTSTQIADAMAEPAVMQPSTINTGPTSRKRRTSDASTHTTASTHSSVLGKRAASAASGPAANKRPSPNKPAAGAASGVRQESSKGSVNGIVKQLNGMVLHAGRRQSRAGAKPDEGVSKAPAKIAKRTPSFIGMRGTERHGVA